MYPSRFYLYVALLILLCGAAHALAANPPKSTGGGYGRPQTPPPPPPPQQTISPLPADQKEVDAARTDLAKAQKALDDATNKLLADFEKTPEAIDAKKAVAGASAKLQTAREDVNAGLAKDPAYTAAVAREKASRDVLNTLRENSAPPDDISAKAKEVFEDGSVTSKIIRAASDANPAYKTAEQKLADANKTLAELHAKFKESLKSDTALAPLRQARDDAQTKLTAAQTKLNSDRKGGPPSPAPPPVGG